MRLGCGGCLLTLTLLAATGTSVWGTVRALRDPGLSPARVTADDAAHAQQKIFRLIRGSATDPLVLTEGELNAVVARNLDPRDLPFNRPTIALRDGDNVEIAGHVPLAQLLADSSLRWMTALLPAAWGSRPVWLQVRAHAELEHRPRPQLQLDVRRVLIGQQRVPAVTLRLIVDPTRLRFLRVTLPDTVADLRIHSGRVVIRLTSSRERT